MTSASQLPVPEKLLDKNHADRTARAKQLTELLERYERVLDLRERKETIERLLEARSQMTSALSWRPGSCPKSTASWPAYGDIDTADAMPCWTATRANFCATSTTRRCSTSAAWPNRNTRI